MLNSNISLPRALEVNFYSFFSTMSIKSSKRFNVSQSILNIMNLFFNVRIQRERKSQSNVNFKIMYRGNLR